MLNEEVFYTLIVGVLVAFFIISVYNLIQKKIGHKDIHLRISLDIAIEIMLIIIGIIIGSIWYHGKISKVQLRFFGHCFIFLIMTGITAIIPTIDRLENN